MMRYLGLILWLLLATSVWAVDYPPVKVERINERVYAMLGPTGIPNKDNRGFVNNNLVIIGDEGVILVDAGSHRDVAKHIHAAIGTVTDKPVTHILITHHHSDHHLGAEYYEDAEVLATEYCATQIRDGHASMVESMQRRTGVSFGDANPSVPQTTIAQGSRQEMVIQGVRLELISADTAHTEGDLMIWLPDDGVLASGDVLVHYVNPNFYDGNLKSWVGVVDNTILSLPIKTVMPGHGPLMQLDDVIRFRNMIGDFYSTVEKIYLDDGEEADVRENLDLERWKRMDRYEAMIGRNINKVWLEVEEANF